MTALAKAAARRCEAVLQCGGELRRARGAFPRRSESRNRRHEGIREALAAFGKTEAAAKAGHVPSMIKLGWLRQAADTGDPEGLYLYGMSLPDKPDGANWIRRAAEKGHARAMTEAALRSKNAADRRRWFEAAAKAGEPEGMYRFGVLSGERDWIRKSADKGYAPAMVALGEKEWLEKAAGAGYANAFTKLGQLERAAQMGDPEAKMLLGDSVRVEETSTSRSVLCRSGEIRICARDDAARRLQSERRRHLTVRDRRLEVVSGCPCVRRFGCGSAIEGSR